MNLVEVLIGAALLTLGRKLFWVFAGGVGFAVAVWLMHTYFPEQPQHIVLIAGALGAVAGVLITKFVKAVAVGVGGFLGGGVIGIGLARMIGPSVPEWIAFVVMGVIGVVLLNLAFETALVVISSVAGAMLIARNLPLSEALHFAAVVVLAVAGIAIQWRLSRGARSGKEGQ
jgi:hypothetical protein